MSHSPSTSTLSIADIRATFDGNVLAPDDAGYDEARQVHVGGVDAHPAVIIRPADAAQVAKVVQLARETGLDLAVRSGGHGAGGQGVVDNGIVLDLANLKSLDIDVDTRTAWAEAGLTAGEVTKAAGEHGLAIGFGDTGSVGIGGITLGGGVGFLSRKFGLTIDSLLGAEIVTAAGSVLTVDADTHPDLFWAVRGGGGNFGVVTKFKYQLQEVPNVVGGMLLLPASAEALTSVMNAATGASENLSGMINVMTAPPMPFIPAEHHGKLVIMALLCYAGPADDGEAALAPFRKAATPLADMLRPTPYAGLFPEQGGPAPMTAVSRTLFMDDFGPADAETIMNYLQNSDAPMRAAQLRVLDGAISRVAPEATAYAHRDSAIMGNVAAFYTSPDDKVAKTAWVEEFAGHLRDGDSGGYVNFLEANGDPRQAYPGETWNRLAKIKATYDPENLFRRNINVIPAV